VFKVEVTSFYLRLEEMNKEAKAIRKAILLLEGNQPMNPPTQNKSVYQYKSKLQRKRSDREIVGNTLGRLVSYPAGVSVGITGVAGAMKALGMKEHPLAARVAYGGGAYLGHKVGQAIYGRFGQTHDDPEWIDEKPKKKKVKEAGQGRYGFYEEPGPTRQRGKVERIARGAGKAALTVGSGVLGYTAPKSSNHLVRAATGVAGKLAGHVTGHGLLGKYGQTHDDPKLVYGKIPKGVKVMGPRYTKKDWYYPGGEAVHEAKAQCMKKFADNLARQRVKEGILGTAANIGGSVAGYIYGGKLGGKFGGGAGRVIGSAIGSGLGSAVTTPAAAEDQHKSIIGRTLALPKKVAAGAVSTGIGDLTYHAGTYGLKKAFTKKPF